MHAMDCLAKSIFNKAFIIVLCILMYAKNTHSQPLPEPPIQTTVFSAVEIDNILKYWNQPGRYVISTPNGSLAQGPWRLSLSTEGSKWIWNYNKLRKLSAPPNKNVVAKDPEHRLWDAWLDRKIEFDRWQVAQSIKLANFPWNSKQAADFASIFESTIQIQPVHPGPIPPGLLKLAGNPPCFAAITTPLRYTILFDNETKAEFHDNIHIKNPKFAYLRFNHGVHHRGPQLAKMSSAELSQMCKDAGLSTTQAKVLKAISELEGGFETLNTYDTGYISVGFVQFTTGSDGNGTLCKVLKQYKDDDPTNYQLDFHRYGIDINPKGVLVVIDPTTGAEISGPDAVKKMIDDKRLIAVFQRAGAKSRSFKLAQMKAAANLYYPANHLLRLTLAGSATQIRVGDIFRSEAGLATVMDNKLNKGNIKSVQASICSFAQRRGLSSPGQLAGHEKELIKLVTYRKNFLTHKELTKP